MESAVLEKYQRVLDRVRAAMNPVGRVETLGTLDWGATSYPFLKITLGHGPQKALLSAGIHGDEPAGVEALCTFLEQKRYEPFLEEWEFHILPCINPTGFEMNTRENHAGEDLNRLFKHDRPNPEVTAVQKVFDEGPFDLDLELHEDVDSPGYYLYQKDRVTPHSPLGRRILSAVEEVMPLNLAEEIEEVPAERGLLVRLKEPDEMEWWPMALYAFVRGCNQIFTLETACRFSLEQRVAAHLTAIQTALLEYPATSQAR